ncbi:hypothetical protein [Pseudaminobacter salicylatoxidans]|uniref:hypothetical protein n=1 Tax=Pseudaminobacter salicylatoxidans TaxID=93369 RepID=UPI0002F58DE6
MSKPAETGVFDPQIVWPAIGHAFAKLHPMIQIRNPVMFVVEMGAVLTTLIFLRDLVTGSGHLAFSFQVILWLWFTVLFANFAEAVAEDEARPRPMRCARRVPRQTPSSSRRTAIRATRSSLRPASRSVTS